MNPKEELKQELEKLSPLLNQMKEEGTGMRVPENYFKNLSNEFFDSLEPENPVVDTQVKGQVSWIDELINSISWFFQPKPALAFASVLAFVFAAWFVFNQPETSIEQVALEDIPTEVLESFLEENIEDFSAEMLVDGNEDVLDENLQEQELYEEYLEELIEEEDLEDLL